MDFQFLYAKILKCAIIPGESDSRSGKILNIIFAPLGLSHTSIDRCM